MTAVRAPAAGGGTHDTAKAYVAFRGRLPAGTQAQLEVKLAARDNWIERKIADMVQTLDVAKRAGLTA